MAHTVNSLIALRDRLTPRDMEIISFIEQVHCAFTHQLMRIFFNESSTEEAASKACRRNLNKLMDYKLVSTLDRKIGGYRSGSSAFIWYLTDAGYKLLDLEDPDSPVKRRRFVEPSSITLRHRLSSVECYVQILELSRKVARREISATHNHTNTTSLTIRKAEFEPKSWRQYTYNDNHKYLRPDLFMSMEKNGYEYLFFIEIDLASESMTDILRHCENYHDCYNSQTMQKKYDLFPIVLWIVPDIKRKERFINVLTKQYEKTNHLFAVITADELNDFMLEDIDSFKFI